MFVCLLSSLATRSNLIVICRLAFCLTDTNREEKLVSVVRKRERECLGERE